MVSLSALLTRVGHGWIQNLIDDEPGVLVGDGCGWDSSFSCSSSSISSVSSFVSVVEAVVLLLLGILNILRWLTSVVVDSNSPPPVLVIIRRPPLGVNRAFAAASKLRIPCQLLGVGVVSDVGALGALFSLSPPENSLENSIGGDSDLPSGTKGGAVGSKLGLLDTILG